MTLPPLAQVDDYIRNTPLSELVGASHSPGHEHRVGYYQYTQSGGVFFPCDPRPEEVFIEDIAAGLSAVYRFNGQSKRLMTVAEHSWHCSFLGPKEEALERLLHDAPEALIGDQVRPLKALPVYGTMYRKIEDGIMEAIARRFHLTFPFPLSVRLADEAVLGAEIAQNIASDAPCVHIEDAEARASNTNLRLYYWSPELARSYFLCRFDMLWRERQASIGKAA